MDIPALIRQAGGEKCQAALEHFLAAFLHPAFGALPKTELELLVLNLLGEIGAIETRPGLYELVAKLRITRSKARRLIYERELRSRTAQDLDEDLKTCLRTPRLQKNGTLFALEIENPLLADHLRARLQSLGHTSDGTFSPSLVSLSLDAMAALLESMLSPEERQSARAALLAAGAPDSSLQGILKGALKQLGSHLASDAGAALSKEIGQYLGPLLDVAKTEITQVFARLFTAAGK